MTDFKFSINSSHLTKFLTHCCMYGRLQTLKIKIYIWQNCFDILLLTQPVSYYDVTSLICLSGGLLLVLLLFRLKMLDLFLRMLLNVNAIQNHANKQSQQS